MTRPDFAAGPFPPLGCHTSTLFSRAFFRHTFLPVPSLLPLPQRYLPLYNILVYTLSCELYPGGLYLETVPWRGLRVALEGVGIGWTSRRALYNKRYRNDLPRLEKSDMKNPKFDISAFLHRPSYQLIIWKTDLLSMFPFLESSYCLYSLPSQLTTSWTRR